MRLPKRFSKPVTSTPAGTFHWFGTDELGGSGIQPPLPSLGNILGDAGIILWEALCFWTLPDTSMVLMLMGTKFPGDVLRQALGASKGDSGYG
jgi:ABC-type dipeptide/oligopeptide/nickel transport system permease subunit